jgi:putative DNA primase/helicase
MADNKTLAARFCALFAGYEHAHGRSKITDERREDGKLKTISWLDKTGPTTPALWEQHLAGSLGIGGIPIRSDDTASWAVVDLDFYEGSFNHPEVAAKIEALQIPAILAASKSAGGHVCVFAAEPIPAALFRDRMTEICLLLGYDPKEVFPKQSEHTKEGGNWVNHIYYGGCETTRFAYKPNGDVYSPEEFLDAAEALKVSREWFDTPLSAAVPVVSTKNSTNGKKKALFVLPEKIQLGEQHNTLVAFAGAMRRNGADADMIFAALKEANKRCDKPGPEENLRRIARTVAEYEPSGKGGKVGFSERPDGIYHTSLIQTGENAGKPVSIFVCGPLKVTAYARNTAAGAWSMMLSFSDRDGMEHEIVMKTTALDAVGNQWLLQLKDGGLRIGDNPDAKRLLKRYLEDRPAVKRIRLVERIGWNEDFSVYMLPSGPVPPQAEEAEQYVYKNLGHKQTAHFGVKGTLDEWRDNVAKFCVGNSRLTFCMSAAFLGPLLPLTSAPETKGFHYVAGTSTGKSTALRVAGSVYGGGSVLGFLQSWSGTANAMEAVSEAHNHAFLGLDELALIDAKKAGQVAYAITSGAGKLRLNRDSELREAFAWLTVVFSSGEISLEEHMRSADQNVKMMGGQEIRLVPIPGDAGLGYGVFEQLHGSPTPAAFSEMLKRNTNEYYGTALIAWVTALAGGREELVKRAGTLVTEFRAKYAAGAGPQVGRASEAFGLVAAAGELASELGITGWPVGEANSGAAACFAAWRAARGTEGSSDEANMLSAVRHYFQQYGSSRFEALEPKPGQTFTRDVIIRAGYRTPEEFWVFDGVFEKDICRGFDHKRVARVLATEGYLIVEMEGKRRRFKTRRDVPGLGKTRVYVLLASIVGDPAEQRPLSPWEGEEAA